MDRYRLAIGSILSAFVGGKSPNLAGQTRTVPSPRRYNLTYQPKGDEVVVRTLVVSDVHSNLEALEAVMADAADRGGFDQVWCLGDAVGYGPDPGLCLSLLRSHDLIAVAGNHDFAAVGKRTTQDFNGAARAAAVWTHSALSPEDSEFLSALPFTETRDPFTLVHGSLRQPIDEYLLDAEAAQATLELLQGRFLLVGHSHLPFICRENGGEPEFRQFTEDEVFPLGTERLIINPGSVGQPRDRDRRPSYAIYDQAMQTIERHRVEYDIARTQQKMRAVGLPEYLIDRLDHGL